MKKYLFSLLFVFLCSYPAWACLNGETKTLKDGTILYEDFEGFVPHGHFWGGIEDRERLLRSLEKQYQETKDIDYLSDKGYVLITLGRYQEAIDLYKKIEAVQPNRYSTASNMGTAYELIGNDAEALHWIEKSIAINSKSHEHSEWIHVNILKAKLKGKNAYTSKFLVGTDFGNGKLPVSSLSKKELYALREQLYYQLNERISFVTPKDVVVAQLLFDLGNISYLYSDKDDAMEDYKMAQEYGFESPLLKERMTLHSTSIIGVAEKKIISEAKFQTKSIRIFQSIETLISVFALMFSAVLILIFRKKIFLILR
ncbi:tetratricopeptide repeat protein [Chryseobacterium soli]|uniref:tetratricopeptide repeat protein n=1 Tax=Chryseobacterium soli TaxID=445961 RepID=UPI0029548088|nr:tetratricopeptide repeat protein [Chryseobacterium soli]MDV7699211.1 tetratricopeptide repeat protein [Chryseobacterium soli]